MKRRDNKYCFAQKLCESLYTCEFVNSWEVVMSLIKKSVSLVFNSDAKAGAQNISADLSSFDITLNDPLSVPRDAVECSAAIISASIWNTAYNISASFNNNKIRFTTSVAPASVKTLTIAVVCIVSRA